MRKLSIASIAIILLAMAMASFAQKSGNYRYKWTDGQGRLHFSDSLTSDAMKYGYDVVSDRGTLVRRIPRQLNAEERAEANRIAQEQAAKERAARELANAESQMLSAYPDEESYQILQKQTLETIDQRIHTTQVNLRSQEKALSELLNRAAEIERGKTAVPKFIADSIASQRDVVASQRRLLNRAQDERERTEQQQAKEMARYRELKAAQLKEQGGG